MSDYQILNWPKMFPHGTDPQDILMDPSRARAIQNLVGLFLSEPHLHKKDIFGNTPALIQNFYNTPRGKEIQNFDQEKKKLYQIQHHSTTSAFEEFWNNLQEKFVTAPTYDQGFNMLFRNMPLDGQDSWEIMDVSNRIEFSRIREGESIKYFGHGDAKARANVYFYGAGYGITRQSILTRKWMTIEDGLTGLREAAYRKEAEIYYALIEAITAAQNISWQTTNVAGTDARYTPLRDMNTFNFAAESIITQCKDKGYGELINATFVILHQYTLTERVKRALNLTLEQFAGSPNLKTYKFMPLPTTMLTDPSKIYVILPMLKMQKATLLALQQFKQFNQTNFLEEIADWMAFGGIIGDEEQLKRCATV